MMKRVPQWVINCLVALSLLMCLFTIALWVRSAPEPIWLGCEDVLSAQRAGRGIYLASSGGQISLNYVDVSAYDRGQNGISFEFGVQSQSGWQTRFRAANPSTNLEFAGFYFAASTHVLRFPNGKGGPVKQWDFGVPHWFVALVFGVWPLERYLTYRRRRQRKMAGHFCEGCGYDLRATPERCPECGKIVEKAHERIC